MVFLFASMTSYFELDAMGAFAWGGSALAALGIGRLSFRSMARGIERHLDPVVERNLERGVFSHRRLRVETEEVEEAEAVKEVEEMERAERSEDEATA